MPGRSSRKAGPTKSRAACHPPVPAVNVARKGPVPDPALRRRLARIEGQVRGLGGMLDEGRYCIDVLTQLAAIQQALRGVGRSILERHLQTCVAEAMTSGRPEEAERVSRELGDLLDRWNR